MVELCSGWSFFTNPRTPVRALIDVLQCFGWISKGHCLVRKQKRTGCRCTGRLLSMFNSGWSGNVKQEVPVLLQTPSRGTGCVYQVVLLCTFYIIRQWPRWKPFCLVKSYRHTIINKYFTRVLYHLSTSQYYL